MSMASKRKNTSCDEQQHSKKRKTSKTLTKTGVHGTNTRQRNVASMINDILRNCGYENIFENKELLHDAEKTLNYTIAVEILKSASGEELLEQGPFWEQYLRLKSLNDGSFAGLFSKIVVIGSTGEGSAFYSAGDHSSDIDMLLELHFLSTSEGWVKKSTTHLMENCLNVPGYVFLKDENNDFFSIFDSMNRQAMHLSSMQIKGKIVDALRFIKGPALSLAILNEIYFCNVSCDFTLAVKCNGWPTIATEWIARKRKYCWPKRRQIRQAVRIGCHLVQKGKEGTELEEYQWRLSFSVIEKDLIHSINKVQYKVYIIFKLLVKQIMCDEHSADVISSYVVKTTALWVFEETDSSHWLESNVIEYVLVCFHKLYVLVKEGFCPNYFMRSCNLFHSKIKNERQKRGLEKILVKVLRKENLVSELQILFKDQSEPSEFGLFFTESSYRLYPRLHLEDIDMPFRNLDTHTIINKCWQLGIINIDEMEGTCSSEENIINKLMFCYVLRITKRLSCKTKGILKQKVDAICNLTRNSKTDLIVAEVIQIAHFYFCKKNYSKTFEMVSKLLEVFHTQKYTRLNDGLSYLNTVKCLQKKKRRINFPLSSPMKPIHDLYFFESEFNMLSSDIQLEMRCLNSDECELGIDPMVYAGYMKYICSRELNHSSLDDNLKELRRYVCVEDTTYKPIGLNLLDCCLMKNGCQEEALEMFLKSYKSRPGNIAPFINIIKMPNENIESPVNNRK